MPMHYTLFSIPAHAAPGDDTELNRFLSSHKIGSIEKNFVADGQQSYWAFCVGSVEGQETRKQSGNRSRIDYKEVLSEREFALYAKLRDLRKKIAEEEAIPAYAVFTNEQMAEMVKQRVTSATALGAIPGIGKARIDKYGPRFLPLLRGQPHAEDNTGHETQPHNP